MRKRIFLLINSVLFSQFIILVVLINTISLGLEGLEEQIGKTFSDNRDNASFWFTIIFLIEMILKLFGLGPRNYLKDRMNILDGFICVTSMFELYF